MGRRTMLATALTLALGPGAASELRQGGQPPAPGAGEPAASVPLESGLVEQTGRRLAQFVVTVLGPPSRTSRLTPGDFEVTIDGRAVDALFVDPLRAGQDLPRRATAAATPGGTTTAVDPSGTEATATSPATTVSYMLYFDQAHLTPAGRARAIDVARQLVPELIDEHSRAKARKSNRV